MTDGSEVRRPRDDSDARRYKGRMNFVFEQIRVGGDRNFAYLVGDRAAGVAAVIDPAYKPEEVRDRAVAQGLRVEHLLNTHGHADHTNGNAWIERETGVALSTPRDGDEIGIGSLSMRVLFVPGHAPDHLLFWLPEWKVALTGDLLFVGKIGGTSTEKAAREEYESLQRVLRELPDDTTIWPGHDYGCRPASTIALEKRTNPFLLAPDFDAFLRLKADWAEYKARLGLR
jgi:glyoxylase-like metal-dependent hydrolase (beta-lactamase superfamily II)